MTFEEYQVETNKTAVYPSDTAKEAVNYCILGLAGEAGELANKFKKCLRDDNGVVTDKKHQELFDEAGDCLWYLSQLATELRVSMSDIAKANIEKLQRRRANNTISGSGDNR